jgi:hypothetical protein
MLFLVIEHFKNNDPKPVRDRFVHAGRMMPEGVLYHGSWIDSATARCFQVMEAESASLLQVWTANWEDIVEFEIIPVLSSQEYWEKQARTPEGM